MSSSVGLAIDSRYVYVTDDKGAVHALDLASGASLWKQDKLFMRKVTAPVARRGLVAVADAEGIVHFMKRDDGSPRCVACMMCSTVCPADCIKIVAGEHPDPSIEKFPLTFEIDLLRCVYCGLCEEACPCDAIRMDTGIYEIAADSREKFVVDKEFLLNNDTEGTR